MTPEDPELDRDLARRFVQTRRADEARAPDLGALLARPARPWRSAMTLPGTVAAAAAALAIAAGLAVVLRGTVRRGDAAGTADLPAAAAELSHWKSPTDALLRTPGSELRTDVPEIAPSVPALDSPPPLVTTKGVAS